MTEDQAALVKVVGRHFDGHAIASQRLNPVLFHLSGCVSHDFVAGVELNAIARVWQEFDDKALELDEFFLGHFFIPSDCRLHRGESRCCGLTTPQLRRPILSAACACGTARRTSTTFLPIHIFSLYLATPPPLPTSP